MDKENRIPPTKMPERFVLEKLEINYILKSIRKHWNRSEMTSVQNAGYTSMMVTMQGLISTPLVNIITLKNVYFSVQEAAMQLATLNQLKISLLDAIDQSLDAKIIKSFQQLYDIQYNKIGSGKAFES